MAEVKKINDQYTISAPTIIIDGNLTVSGSTTSVETTNSTITDNTIVLNEGETGTGITAGTSGIEVDRGTADSATFLFNEADDAWEHKIGTNFSITRGLDPVDANDYVTKGWAESLGLGGGSTTVAGNNTEIQYNNSGSFGASSNLTWDGTTLNVTGDITSSATVNTVDVDATGVLALSDFSSPPPSATAGKTKLYAGTPDAGGTGLFFQNTTGNDELVSRRKAIVYGIIF
jgi:hypothetical protein